MNNHASMWNAVYCNKQQSYLSEDNGWSLGKTGEVEYAASCVFISKIGIFSESDMWEEKYVGAIGEDGNYPSVLGDDTSGDVGMVG